MRQAGFLDRPSVLSLCSLCSATWKAETGPTEEWLFSPFCRDNKKVAALCEKYFCSSLLETELFIGLTAHHCGLGLTRYSNLSVSRVGGVVWYIKYLCNLFLFFLSTESQHDCVLQWKLHPFRVCLVALQSYIWSLKALSAAQKQAQQMTWHLCSSITTLHGSIFYFCNQGILVKLFFVSLAYVTIVHLH